MRLLIDIGHPGHVHYFRNLYFNLKDHGHKILIVARDKEVSFRLLDHYQIPFISRGKGSKSFFRRLIYLWDASFLIFRQGWKFRPDIIISFASPYASIASFFLRCRNIVLDDTEVGRFERYIYKPLANIIITPSAFKEVLGKKQFRFNGFMELSYLLPAYFNPNPEILEYLGIGPGERFIIVRFVSWEARHDEGQTGLSIMQKHEIISLCQQYAKVFISSEGSLPETLEEYRLKINPHQLHDALSFASIYIGEGATTATEACILGTPSVYINSINAGTLEEEEKFGILFNFRNYDGVIDKISQLLKENNKDYYKSLAKKMIDGRTDLTALLIWLIEGSGKNLKILKQEPEYQDNFRYNA
jgi:uncharacterized protein